MTTEAVAHEGAVSRSEFRAGAAGLTGSLLCMILGPAVVGFYTFSLFLEPLGQATGEGRAALSFGITVGTLATALSAPWIGWLIERYDERRVLTTSAVALGLVTASLYFLGSNLVGLYTMLAAVGVLCSSFYITVPRVISSLFDRHRGLALGLAMSGTGLGTIVVMPLVQQAIEAYGWRAAYATIGALVLLISLPSAAFLIPRRKQGAQRQARATTTGAGEPAEPGRLSGKVLLLALTFFLVGLSLHAVIIHFVPMLTSKGFTPAQAAAIYAVAGTTIFAGRIGCGLLMDLLPANRVGATLFLLAASGILLMHLGTSTANLYLAAALFGLGVGAEMDVLGYLVSRLFGLHVFAGIYGMVYGAFMLGTSLGPLLFGYFFDALGNYAHASWLATVLTVIGALLLLLVRLPASARARA